MSCTYRVILGGCAGYLCMVTAQALGLPPLAGFIACFVAGSIIGRL